MVSEEQKKEMLHLLENMIMNARSVALDIKHGYEETCENGWITRSTNGTATIIIKLNGGAVAEKKYFGLYEREEL